MNQLKNQLKFLLIATCFLVINGVANANHQSIWTDDITDKIHPSVQHSEPWNADNSFILQERSIALALKKTLYRAKADYLKYNQYDVSCYVVESPSDPNQNTAVEPNGEVFSPSEIIGIAGNSRLHHINSRYKRNTSDVRTFRQLESNSINEHNVVEECLKYLRKHSERLGINPDNLILWNVMHSKHSFTPVFFQTYQGYEIRNSVIRMHCTPTGEISIFEATYFHDVNLPKSKPTIALQTAEESAIYALTGNNYQLANLSTCILPIFNGNGFDYTLIYDYEVQRPAFEMYRSYVDANTGELLFRKNLVHHNNINLPVKSRHYGGNPNEPLIDGSIPGARVTIEGEANTRTVAANGQLLSVPETVVGKTFTTKLESNSFKMQQVMHPNDLSPATDYTFTGNITSEGLMLIDSNNKDEVFRTIFNNVVKAQRYFTGIDQFALPTGSNFTCYVQMLADNANKDQLSYEFNASALADVGLLFLCANHNRVFMGKSERVAFHEYGHTMVASKYKAAGNQTNMFSSFANEANADIASAFITNSPYVFENVSSPDLVTSGWTKNSGLYRTCDNEMVYPDDFIGRAHDDNQILSGAFWRFNTLAGNNSEDAQAAIHFAKEMTPDGFTAEEVFAKWFDAITRKLDAYKKSGMAEYEYLFEPLYHAFDKHKIGFDNLINYKFHHNNADDAIDNTQPVPIQCTIVDLASPRSIDAVYLNYFTNYGTYESILLDKQPNGVYSGEIPPQPEAARIHYWFTYFDPFTFKNVRINRDYLLFAGYDVIYATDFEDVNDPNRWTIDNDAQTTNGFQLIKPQLIYKQLQRPYNHVLFSPGFTPNGEWAWSTATQVTNSKGDRHDQSVSLQRVSRIISPNIQVNGYGHVILSYQKYHYQNGGNPNFKFTIEVSFDNGSTWTEVQSFSDQQKPTNWDWNREYVNITKETGNTNISSIKIRISASNQPTGVNPFHLIIDDVKLFGTNNPVNINESNIIGEINVTPNPASSEATLTFPLALHNPEIQIINAFGNQVHSVKLTGEHFITTLNTTDLANGVYLLKAIAEGRTYQTKLVIAR